MTPARPGRFAVLPILALLLASSCAHLREGARSPRILEVDRDTAWSGEVRVDGIVHVRKGATLSILPGTRVVFADARFGTEDQHEGFFAPGLRVEGTIVAEGTAESPILFTSARVRAVPASWDKILFSFSGENRFLHCIFEGARYAFHAHFSQILVRRCLFRENVEGVRLGASRVTIEDSVFTRNELRGINFRECRNEIRGNLVFENGDGIFLHSKNSESVIRGNAVYANRDWNLRMGDLHAEDIDVSGNWWGSGREAEARKTIYDGARLSGIGSARIAPVLSLPPVSGAAIRGIFVVHMLPVAGAQVRAYRSVAGGFWGEDYAAASETGPDGLFRLSVPPGRWFVVGRAESTAGVLFAFPGRNPVAVSLEETEEVGLPAVTVPPREMPSAPAAAGSSSRGVIAVRATLDGAPAEGVTVQAFRPGSPDFRGPGEASAVTGDRGIAILSLPPGSYMLAAKRRTTGLALGMVDEGGLFGVDPHSPVELPPGTEIPVEIPLYAKTGFLSGEEEPSGADPSWAGSAVLGGRPAGGHVVYFYLPPETIGRPLARSSTTGDDGTFSVLLPGPGEYLAFLRRATPGFPAGTEEERIGPVPVRAGQGRILPSPIPFRE